MMDDLGWSNVVLSAGMSVGLVCSGLCAPTVGRIIDTHGARTVMVAGTFVAAAGLLLWSAAAHVVVYLGAWTVIGVGMAMILYEPAFAAVARHAPHWRREAVLTITLLGGLASTIFVPITELLVQRSGWREALLVLASLLVATCTPALLFGVPRRGEVLGPSADDGPGATAERADPPTPGASGAADPSPVAKSVSPTMRSSPALRRLTVAMVLSRVATVVVAAHLVAFLVAGGRTSTLAAGIAAAVGVAKTVGRLAVGYAARWWSTRALLLGSLVASAVGLAAPLVSTSFAGDLVMVVGFGAGAGAVTVLRPLYVVDLFGVAGYGLTSGRMGRLLRFSEAVAPLAVGAIVTLTGSYALAWGLLALGGMFAVPTLPRPSSASAATTL
jgi:predicted MFS family arabinose efflux permease